MNKEQLLKALEIVKPGLANREIIEQSTSFAFMEGRVVTYNDEISLSHPVEVVELKGAVQADELYQFLRKVKADKDGNIVLEQEKNEIRITSGRAKAGLSLQAKIRLPLDEIDDIDTWYELPEDFLTALKFAAGACDRGTSNPKLTCVHVNAEGYVEGCNNIRFVRYTVNEDGFPMDTFLVPAQSAMEVLKIKPLSIAKSESWVHFRNEEDTVMSCRIFEDTYPDATDILKAEGITISLPKTMGEILERAAVFSKRESILDEEVSVMLKKNRIHIHSQSETGWFKEDANMRFSEDPVSFSIVPSLLKDILSETQSCEVAEDRLIFQGAGWKYVISLIAE